MRVWCLMCYLINSSRVLIIFANFQFINLILGVTCQELVVNDFVEIRGTASSSNQNGIDLNLQPPALSTTENSLEVGPETIENQDKNGEAQRGKVPTEAFDLFGWSQPPVITTEPNDV